MNHRTYLLICGAVFFAVAAAHLSRLLTGWEIEVAGHAVPHWLSIPGLVIPGLLSCWGFMLAFRSRSAV